MVHALGEKRVTVYIWWLTLICRVDKKTKHFVFVFALSIKNLKTKTCQRWLRNVMFYKTAWNFFTKVLQLQLERNFHYRESGRHKEGFNWQFGASLDADGDSFRQVGFRRRSEIRADLSLKDANIFLHLPQMDSFKLYDSKTTRTWEVFFQIFSYIQNLKP